MISELQKGIDFLQNKVELSVAFVKMGKKLRAGRQE